ncbi:cell division protein FtsL [Candidatus Odyssella acanthamoebae]|uniref:cell division protein FtsL n=1 Tax=Candidatus Odyssella acanthamoebae TaxID=91604 RepID=UPI00068CFDF7|nr:hypothetical protein [Candidatus Paracaedibacter acanthamoebae]
MRKSTLVVGLLTAAIGFGLFQLKYEMMTLESEYRQLNRNIRLSEESVSVLKAEWAHLTNPSSLQSMARKHLDVDTVTPKQLVSFKRIPKSYQGAVQFAVSAATPTPKNPDSELDMILDEAIKEISFSPTRRGKR